MTPFWQAFFGMLIFTTWDVIMTEHTQKKYAKKSGYNCDTCKNWKCCVKYCERKRKENEA